MEQQLFLSVSLQQVLKLNQHLVTEIVQKAIRILNDRCNITSISTMEGPCFLIKEQDGAPAKVIWSGKGAISCDCAEFKRWSVCCHVVVSCEEMDDYTRLVAKFKYKQLTLDQLFGKHFQKDENGRLSGKSLARRENDSFAKAGH